jgi:phosphoglycolate phosphatase-like HAD superfamily hydrolase
MKIVFDFDGTLVNSMVKFSSIASRLIADSYDLPIGESFELYMDTVGLSFLEQLEEIFPEDPKNEKVADDFLVKQLQVYDVVELHDGVKVELDLLTKCDIPWGVCSSSPNVLVARTLKRLGLTPELTTGRGHGSKITQLWLFENDGYTHFIGDAPRDGVLALDTSLTFVGVEHTFPHLLFKKYGFESMPCLREAIDECLPDSPSVGVAPDTSLLASDDSSFLGT